MIVNLDDMKKYLRVDYQDDDGLIMYLIQGAEKLCLDILRASDVDQVEDTDGLRIAVMYSVAYLYEHREEADHHALTITLRSMLFGSRREVF